jgi:hypothetical protein
MFSALLWLNITVMRAPGHWMNTAGRCMQISCAIQCSTITLSQPTLGNSACLCAEFAGDSCCCSSRQIGHTDLQQEQEQEELW